MQRAKFEAAELVGVVFRNAHIDIDAFSKAKFVQADLDEAILNKASES